MQITIQKYNQGQNKYNSVDTEHGRMYFAKDSKLFFEAGKQYNVSCDNQQWGDRAVMVITGIESSTQGQSAPAGNYSPRPLASSNKDTLITVTALMKSLIEAGREPDKQTIHQYMDMMKEICQERASGRPQANNQTRQDGQTLAGGSDPAPTPVRNDPPPPPSDNAYGAVIDDEIPF